MSLGRLLVSPTPILEEPRAFNLSPLFKGAGCAHTELWIRGSAACRYDDEGV